MKPTLSIITVCYNASATIQKTIQSVLSQNYPIEYIVIDGASTDNSLSIINEYAQSIKIIICEPDNGIYDAMNKGLALAKGEVIGFLNSDDHYADGSVLSIIMEKFNNTNVDACFGDCIYFAQNQPEKIIRYWQSCPFKIGAFARGWSPPHPTFFVRREIYKRYGFFDTTFKLGNDIELMMRFLEKYKINTQYIPKVLVKMQLGGVSNRSVLNILTQNKAVLQAAKKNNIPISPYLFFLCKIGNRFMQFILKPKGENNYAH